jgi:TPR repeat protein
VKDEFEQTLQICLNHHSLACIRVGNYFYSYETSPKNLPQFQPERLADLFDQTAKTSEVIRKATEKDKAKKYRSKTEFSDQELDDIDSECLKQSRVACVALGRYGLTRKEFKPSKAESLMYAITADRIAKSCKDLPTTCSKEHWYRLLSGSISIKDYDVTMAGICREKKDPYACRESGVGMESYDRAGSLELLQIGCANGNTDACNQVAERMITRGETAKALQFAVKGCVKGEFNCHKLIEEFAEDTGSAFSPKIRNSIANYACNKGSPEGCMLLHKLQVGQKKYEEARKGFGIMCDNSNILACRMAAQVEWILGNKNAADNLLRVGCEKDEINSCYELANLLAAMGSRKAALALYEEWCEKGSPSVCKSKDKYLAGRKPSSLNQIFTFPLDGEKSDF